MTQPKSIVVLLIAVMSLAKQSMAARELWVAPDGNDQHTGTKDQPLATSNKAQQMVRRWIADGLKEDVTVWFSGGVYRLESPWVLTAEDSPGDKHSVTYAASPGESVILSGARQIKGWQPTGSGPWRCELAAGKWPFRQLVVNGRRAVRARYPNLDEPHPFVHIAALDPPREHTSSRLKFRPEQLAAWSQPAEAEIVILGSWEIIRKRLKGVDPAAGTVELASPHIVNHVSISPKLGQACYFENAREMLDRPGEWFLDRRSGELLYWPLSGEDMENAIVEAPVVERLLELHGTQQRPIKNVHFRGLRFENADWPLPKLGYYGLQACFHNTIDMKNGEDDSRQEYWTYVDPAVRWQYAHRCSLRDGAIQHTSGGGISVGIGCHDNVVEGNLVADVGANGIMVGEPWAWRYEQDRDCKIPAEDVARNNRVANNHVRDCGVCYHGGVGIWDGFTDSTTIAHNEVHSLPYTGISVGFIWRDWPTVCRNNLVEFNHVYDVVNWLGDSGGIYMLGRQPGTTIRSNLVHATGYSTQSCRELVGGRGIYFDQGSTGFRAENNVVYDVPGPAMYFNTGKTTVENHKWANNSFIDTRPKTGEGRWGRAIWGDNGNYLQVAHSDRLDPPTLTAEALFFQKLHDWHGKQKDARDWLVAKNGNEHQDGHYSLLIDGDRVGAYLNIGGGPKGLHEAWSPRGAWQLYRWNHAAMTYDGSTLRVYLDGKRVAETAVGKPRTIGHGVLMLTRRADGLRPFCGALDEVCIFDRALSPSEILRHARAAGPLAVASETNLAGYWSFDDIPEPPPAAKALQSQVGPESPYRKRHGLRTE
jgi:hypothetical protein